MKLPESAKDILSKVFYSIYSNDDGALRDAMSVLKIMDFEWDSKNRVLVDSKTERPMPKEKSKESPWQVIPVKNLTNFDVDCIEKVLNTRVMEKLKPESLSPLLESIGWNIQRHGDTYRIHFVGGTDYWESHDFNQWDKGWTEGWQEPWIPDSIKNPWAGEADTLKIVRLQYPRIDWDTDKKIPEEWT